MHAKVSKALPIDTPEPLGKQAVTISYHDDNSCHNALIVLSVTGFLHLANKTLINWHSKKQSEVETDACVSEFSFARTYLEQVIDLRNAFRHLGVPLRKKSHMLGENDTAVDSSMMLDTKIRKRYLSLFFRAWGYIAANIISYHFVKEVSNLSDTLSKHWGHSKKCPGMKSLMFWKGDTMDWSETGKAG